MSALVAYEKVVVCEEGGGQQPTEQPRRKVALTLAARRGGRALKLWWLARDDDRALLEDLGVEGLQALRLLDALALLLRASLADALAEYVIEVAEARP